MPSKRVTSPAAPAWTAPDASRSLHLLGDLHIDSSIASVQQLAVADLAAMTAIKRVCVGDLTDNVASANFAVNDAAAIAYLAQFGSVEVAMGNHDVYLNLRTAAQWEAAYATTRNRVVDAGPYVLIFIAPDVAFGDTACVIPTATVNWLDAQLAAATKPCIVVSHAPLFNTVQGVRRLSSSADFYVTVDVTAGSGGTDTAIRTVLGNHSTAFAIVSGHTHADPFNAADFVKREKVGSRYIAAINSSALSYTLAIPQTTGDPIYSVLVTVPASGDRVEARVRSHTLRKWVPCSYGLVATVLM